MKQGWEITILGAICKVDWGNTKLTKQSYKEGGKYLAVSAAGCDGRINHCEHKKHIPVLSAIGAQCGKMFFPEEDFTAIKNTITLTPNNEKVNNKFLFHLLNFVTLPQRGAGQPFISKGDIEKFEVRIPISIAEQQRIVAVLDEAFNAIAKAKANAEQNLKNAAALFESYLQGVFENKGEDWEEKKLIEITSKIGSGATPRGGNESYKSEGISLVRSMNVHDFEFRDKNLAFIDDQQAKELNNVTLQENDVLLNITGASVARCCVIPKEYLPARVNQHVSIIRAKKEIIDPIFLNLLLSSKFYKDQLLFTGEQGATRQAITKAQLEVFKIAFPKSINEQKKLLNKLESLSSETKKLETIYQQKINDLEELKKSVLQKAFSGELKTEKVLV